MVAPRKSRPISKAHKAALAEGRAQGRAVRRYLEALESSGSKHGRRRSPESIEARLAQIDEVWGEANPITRLHLAQERIDLRSDLDELSTPTIDLDSLEDEFVANAARYADRKGLTYGAFREVGVAPAVLRRAGIRRGA